jgi:hypothetical protein
VQLAVKVVHDRKQIEWGIWVFEQKFCAFCLHEKFWIAEVLQSRLAYRCQNMVPQLLQTLRW